MGFRSTEERKAQHLRISLEEGVEVRGATTGFEDVRLVHRCLPDIDPNDVDLVVSFLGHRFNAPLFISAMTGGTPEAKAINANLAEAAESLGLGMCVGSQRVALENPGIEATFSVVRERAPKAFISANIGFGELPKLDRRNLKRLLEMVDADALTVHLNALQEMLQRESKPSFRGPRSRLESLLSEVEVPVIVKETGSGMAWEEASFFEKAGVKALEVAGLGGTSWAAVEYHRNLKAGERALAHAAEAFWDWGIPTAASVLEAKHGSGLPLIASGGIRTGLDVLKALVLGASLAGLALPLLKPATEGAEAVLGFLRTVAQEVRIGLTLIGASGAQEAAGKPFILTGATAEWVRQRGLRLSRPGPRPRPKSRSPDLGS